MRFILILTLFGMDSNDQTYVVDYNMSGLDCIEALEKQQVLLEQTFYREDFALSCEMDDYRED